MKQINNELFYTKIMVSSRKYSEALKRPEKLLFYNLFSANYTI
jgi:hypothetical protein